MEGINLPIVNTFYKATVIKNYILVEGRDTEQWDRIKNHK